MIVHPLVAALITLIWVLVTVWLRSRRRWLSYYITAGLGFVLVALTIVRSLGIDAVVEGIEAVQVVAIARTVGLGLGTFGGSTLTIPTESGWAVFDIGIECSGLLEMFVFTSLVGFYPAFSAKRRVATIAVGVVATWIINIARILLIIAIISAMGVDWVYAAHAVFGRVFFFAATVVTYWYLVTRPTVSIVAADLSEAADG